MLLVVSDDFGMWWKKWGEMCREACENGEGARVKNKNARGKMGESNQCSCESQQCEVSISWWPGSSSGDTTLRGTGSDAVGPRKGRSSI